MRWFYCAVGIVVTVFFVALFLVSKGGGAAGVSSQPKPQTSLKQLLREYAPTGVLRSVGEGQGEPIMAFFDYKDHFRLEESWLVDNGLSVEDFLDDDTVMWLDDGTGYKELGSGGWLVQVEVLDGPHQGAVVYVEGMHCKPPVTPYGTQ